MINADLTAEQKAYGTQTDPEVGTVLNTKYEVLEGATASFKGGNLELQNAVIVRVAFVLNNNDVDGVEVRFKIGDETYLVDEFTYNTSEGRYYVLFDKLGANQFRETIYVTVLRDGKPISNTLTYSVESYVSAKQNDTDIPYLAELVKAIMKYGDSARAYING